MLVPPQNVLVFRGFAYRVLDAKDKDGNPLKILSIQDPPVINGLEMMFVFSADEFAVFNEKTSTSRIVAATKIPDAAPKLLAG
jgi:hypothetical protein